MSAQAAGIFFKKSRGARTHRTHVNLSFCAACQTLHYRYYMAEKYAAYLQSAVEYDIIK